jgi:pyridoxine 5-phosphate synthase
MTRLSVNINKIALIRNSRGSNLPDLKQVAKDCERFGAQGITVHPRPDERHIRYDDIPILKEVVKTEFNIEGNPTEKFLSMVEKHKPHQVTLVPDAPGALTSDSGWDTITYLSKLQDIVSRMHDAGVRVSIFLNPEIDMVEGAKKVGTDRIEFYTGDYAKYYRQNREKAIAPFVEAAKVANTLNLGLNAGHDLNLENLNYFTNHIPQLLEVSIGHALVTDALYFGMQNTIKMYLHELQRPVDIYSG